MSSAVHSAHRKQAQNQPKWHELDKFTQSCTATRQPKYFTYRKSN